MASRKYGKSASQKVEQAMRSMKRGKLRSGSDTKVTSRKHAAAIGLTETRRTGGKVTRRPSKKG